MTQQENLRCVLLLVEHVMATGEIAYLAVADLNVIAAVTRTDGGWLLTGLYRRFHALPGQTILTLSSTACRTI